MNYSFYTNRITTINTSNQSSNHKLHFDINHCDTICLALITCVEKYWPNSLKKNLD